MRQMTARGYAFLEEQEGLRLEAYDDATGQTLHAGDTARGVPTIGVGHTGPEVKPGLVIDRLEADRLFAKDCQWAADCVEATCPGANDNEFDAMASLTFNIGAPGFAGSTVARLFRQGDKTGAAKAFGMWNRDAHGVNAGLVARRARETSLFLEPMPTDPPQPMSQSVEPPKPAIVSKTLIGGAVTAAGTASIVAENAKPTIDAINATAATISQASTAWGGLKDALGIFANGNVYTFVILTIALGVIIWLVVRHIREIRAGRVIVK